MPQFQLRIHEQQRLFDVSQQGDQLHVRSDDLTADIHIIHRVDGELLIELVWPDGRQRRIRLAGVSHGDSRQLWVNGRLIPVERVRRRRVKDTGTGSLTASIPAVVSQILVALEEEVTAGQKLILLESMKMVIPIQAPYDGRVKKILCAAGDSVPAGIALVELEPQ